MIDFSHADYTIIKQLGRGSSAVVYLAIQNQLNRKVALKVISTAGLTAIERSRFQREALILARLEHPNIVPVFELSELPESHRYMMVMRYLTGGTLSDKLEHLTLRECIDILRQLASALDYAHRQGYLHRDIKPDNILFDGSQAVLTDFGVARATESRTNLTQTGTLPGTPAYMSPEQISGARLDGRSDLYSLGIVLYEMLTGARPFHSDSALATGIMHVTANVPPLPGPLSMFQSCVDGLLQKKPEHRTPDGQTLIAQLDELRESDRLILGDKANLRRDFAVNQVSMSRETNSERRQITIACIALDNFRELSVTQDPEDLLEIIELFLRTAERAVLRYRGHLVQTRGSDLIAFFGYPTAQEDDATSAVHACEEIHTLLESVDVSSHGLSGICARVGIHTGPVVVGAGAQFQPDTLTIGRTPAIAMELSVMATTSKTLVSESTRKLLRGAFSVSSISQSSPTSEAVESEPVFEIQDVNSVGSRYAAAHDYEETTLIGREEESALLLKIWDTAVAGEGRAALLRGSAGIGKSCIASHIINRAKNVDCHVLLYQCSPYHSDSAFYPVVRHLLQNASYDAAHSAAVNLDRFVASLDLSQNDLADCAGLFGPDLTDLESELAARTNLTELSAREKRERTLSLLLRLLTKLTAEKPVLLIVEDAHWIDPTTQSLIERLLDSIQQFDIFALITSRPEFNPEFVGHSAMCVRELSPLARDSIRQIIEATSSNQILPAQLVDQITDKADGIPLFAEELTKSVLASLSSASSLDNSLQSAGFDTIDVPSSLQDSLIARLDQMQPDKPVAQAAACIGREFSRKLLLKLLGKPENEVSESLKSLCRAGLVRSLRKTDRDDYVFQHALIKDAAYGSLTRARRRDYHARLLDCMLELQVNSKELLAHHAQESEQYSKAANYWERAAIDASKNAAYAESIRYFDKAVQCTHKLENNSESRTRELNLLVGKTHASTALNGFAHPATVQINFAAHALLDQVGETPFRFPVLYGHWVISHAMGKHPDALKDANAMKVEAQQTGDRERLIIAHRVQSASETMTGSFQRARENYQCFSQSFDEQKDKHLVLQYGLDPGVSAAIYQSLNLICQAELTEALKLHGWIELRSQKLSHPHTLIYALSHLALTGQVGRLPDREKFIHASNDMVDEHGLMAYKGHSVGIHAMFLYDQGAVNESLERMNESLAIIEQTKTHIYSPLLHAYHSACLTELGDSVKAEHAYKEAIFKAETGHERWALAEIHRVVAEADFRSHRKHQPAIDRLSMAISIAKKQHAWLWQLRASVALATILTDDDGESEQAQVLLRDALSCLPSSGFRNIDVATATEFLKQLD